MTLDLFRPFISADDAVQTFSKMVHPDEHGRVYVGEGAQVAKFEQEFSTLVGAPWNVLTVNSCTSALDLSLHLAGVGLGTDVITTPMTCSATNTGIVNRKGTIVWADVDPETGLIDPQDVARKITKRTKAIIAVDWAGRSCDYTALRRAIPKWMDIKLIQDAAHNLFPDWHNRGDYVCWSFQAIKHLTTGDGGALLTPAYQRERARLLRWYGLDRNSGSDFRCAQDIKEAGYKYHMNDIAAAIGLANLPHAEWVVDRHREHAAFYGRAIHVAPGLSTPSLDPGAAWWLYTLLVDERDSFVAHMTARGIATSQVHRRNDEHPAFYFPSGALPGVDAFSAREVAIPVGWWLSDADVQYIADSVNEWTAQEAEIREVVTVAA